MMIRENSRRSLASLLLVATIVLTAVSARAQEGKVLEEAVDEAVEQIFQHAGNSAMKELAEMGGESATRELLDKAAAEGGPALVKRLATLAVDEGPGVLRVASESPGKISEIVEALESVKPDLRSAALHALEREPINELKLIGRYGDGALETEARHPGVGTLLVKKLGREGIDAGKWLPTDDVTLLVRHADDVAALPEKEQSVFWAMLRKQPARTLEFLEAHPQVLKYGSHVVIAGIVVVGGSAGVYAMRKELFGEPIPGGRGAIPRMWYDFLGIFYKPLSAICGILGLALAVWSCIHLWKAVTLARLRVRKAQAALSPAAQGDETRATIR